MNSIEIKIQKEPGSEDLPLPTYQTAGSSGCDLYAAINNSVVIEPGTVAHISTGIRVAIPWGYEGQVRPRSGLSLRHGIGILNSPGTIDSDYRGIIGIILFNFSKQPFIIHRGDRIAQLVIARYEKVKFTIADTLDKSSRNSEGFGSTGLN